MSFNVGNEEPFVLQIVKEQSLESLKHVQKTLKETLLPDTRRILNGMIESCRSLFLIEGCTTSEQIQSKLLQYADPAFRKKGEELLSQFHESVRKLNTNPRNAKQEAEDEKIRRERMHPIYDMAEKFKKVYDAVNASQNLALPFLTAVIADKEAEKISQSMSEPRESSLALRDITAKLLADPNGVFYLRNALNYARENPQSNNLPSNEESLTSKRGFSRPG